MDDYGIGAAALVGLEVYSQASRRSGRTTRMIRSLRGGETVACLTHQEANRVRSEIKRVNPVLGVEVVTAKGLQDPVLRGRDVVFDERLVEAVYRAALVGVTAEFERMGTLRFAGGQLPPNVAPPAHYNWSDRV